MTLAGRVALVTGASQGIGRVCALNLAAAGATVVVAARNQEKLNTLVGEISASGGKAKTAVMDVADEEQIKSAFSQYPGPLCRIALALPSHRHSEYILQYILRFKRRR